jgi:hypothetical protein
MVSALGHAGCLVVTSLADRPARSRVVAELASHLEVAPFKTEDDPAAFYPGLTQRVTALVVRSGQVRELILHPTVTAICDHFLGPNAPDGYQLHVTAALNVAPGARAQVLHREEDPFTIFPLPRPHLVVATMWAITDFRAENGATLLVPGSHRWTSDRQPIPDEIVAAEMPAGSVLFWLGGTLPAPEQTLRTVALRRDLHVLRNMAASGREPVPRRTRTRRSLPTSNSYSAADERRTRLSRSENPRQIAFAIRRRRWAGKFRDSGETDRWSK